MRASQWLKENAPPEIQKEIQENFRFALDTGMTPMARIVDVLRDRGASLPEHVTNPEHADDVVTAVQRITDEVERLHKLIHNSHTEDFLESVRTEAAHQRERWGTEHDAGKSPEDWLFLMGCLGTKACQAHRESMRTREIEHVGKALHHTISTAAACLNWHAAIASVDLSMRPGIDPPEE